MANGPELLLKPTHGLIEERRGFLRESAALLVQLCAQPAKRASSARKLLPVPMNGVHKSKQPLLRRTQAVPLRPGCAKLLEAPLHHGFGEFFLGFEVVVDIAYRHAGRLGDVRQTRLSETASIRQLRRSLNQSRSLVRLCRAHILRLGGVSYLTNSDPAYMMFNSTMWIQVFSTDRKWSARERMLIDSLDATSAAFEVGYESATQFNREYSRFFGQPPKRDIRTLRSPGAAPLESVSNQ